MKLARKLHTSDRRIRKLLVSNGVKIRSKEETAWNRRGFHHSIETKMRISKAHKGMPKPKPKGFGKGRKITVEQKQKLSMVAKRRIGSLNPNWRGGVTTINEKIRKSDEYRVWRNGVFVRDNYTCKFCGQYGGELCADHIQPFSIHPALRLDVNNGRTLCVECHRQTPTYAGKLQQKILR